MSEEEAQPIKLVDPVDRLIAALGHSFADRALLVEALTHRSYVNECTLPGVRDNERLEFLGDAVIDLVVSTSLMERYPTAREGSLSRMRASIVNESALSRISRALHLGEALRLGRGEDLSGGRERISLLADAFEALIAAVYLDAGFARAKEVLLPLLHYPAESEVPFGDPKTALQERIQAELHITPQYRVVAEDGPDHSKVFNVEILLDGEVRGRGQGRTKKEAEQQAAALVLAALDAERASPATEISAIPEAPTPPVTPDPSDAAP